MAVIGNSATQQAFTPAVDYFSGNGSTTAFTLSRPVASVAQVEAVIDNVVQNPSSAYTVSGNTITFTSAPLSGTNNIYVRYTSPITQVIAPGQGTVNTTALAGGTVTTTADATLNGLTVGKGGGSVTQNTVVGASAGSANTTGKITAVGYLAARFNTTGSGNTAIGGNDGAQDGALYYNTTGNYNIAMGTGAVASNTTGSSNTGLGYQALNSNTTASNNTAVGYQAGYTMQADTENTAVGYRALYLQNGGGVCDAFGARALYNNTTGSANAAFGQYALYSNTTGQQNVSMGQASLYPNTTGSYNTALGHNALRNNTTASDNTAVGYQAAYSNQTGTGITALGKGAAYAVTGNYNTVLGWRSGEAITSGQANTIVGALAGNLSTGSKNTFIGGPVPGVSNGCASAMTTGSSNTIIGNYNGNQSGLDIRTTSNNIVLSDGDGNPRLYCNSNGRWSMNGGTSALTPVFQIYSTTQDADLQLGSTQNGNDIHLYLVNSTRTSELSQISNNLIARCGGSGGVYLSNGATSWAAYSDSRLKNVTGTYTNALADVAKLEPVKFTWKHDEDKKPCVGLIAQSIEKVVPEAIDKIKKTDYKETGDETEYLSVRYSELIPLLTASIQELKSIVDAQAAEIAELKAKVGV